MELNLINTSRFVLLVLFAPGFFFVKKEHPLVMLVTCIKVDAWKKIKVQTPRPSKRKTLSFSYINYT